MSDDYEISMLRFVDWVEAVNWIGYRDLAAPPLGPLHGFELQGSWEDVLYADSGRKELAEELLLENVRNGLIGVFASLKLQDSDGKTYTGEFEKIPRHLFSDEQPEFEDYDQIYIGENEYTNFWICFNDLIAVFPEKKEESERSESIEELYDVETVGKVLVYPNVRTEASQSSRRGRRPTYNWEEFFTEVAVVADLDSLPEKQAQLETQMLEWCARTWGREPAESMVRSKISPIYNHPRKKADK